MLTDKQEETFQRLKDGKLTASEKADFYYRLSGILKKDLEGLKDLSRLFDEIPEGYLKKINIQDAAIHAMALTEKLVKKVGPVPYTSKDKAGKFHIVRQFRVNVSGQLPGVTAATALIEVVYEATEEERQFFSRFADHLIGLNEMKREYEMAGEVLTPEEMEKRISSIVKGRPYTANVVGMSSSPTEETKTKIEERNMSLTEAGVPNLKTMDLKIAGLEKDGGKEPKNKV